MLAPTKITPSCLAVLSTIVSMANRGVHVTVNSLARENWTSNVGSIQIALERLHDAGMILIDGATVHPLVRWIPADELQYERTHLEQ